MSVFVLGMHRSGTSMAASICEALGYHVGEEANLLPRNEFNQLGYFENVDAVSVNEKLLTENGLNWRVLPAAVKKRLTGVSDYLKAIEEIVAGLESNRPWCIKDPRLSFLLPHWRAAAPDAAALVCLRRPEAVAYSLQRRNDLAPAYGAALWELYTLEALKNTRKMPRAVLVYEDLIADPESRIRALAAQLREWGDVDPTEDQIAAAIARVRPDLDHGEELDPSAGISATEPQVELYAELRLGNLALPPARETAGVSRELVRLEAAHQAAKARVAQLDEAKRAVSAELERQAREQARFLERLQDLIDLAGGGKGLRRAGSTRPGANEPSADELVEMLAGILRTATEREHALSAAQSMRAEAERLHEERTGWLKSQLEAQEALGRDLAARLHEAERRVHDATQTVTAEAEKEIAGLRRELAEQRALAAGLEAELAAARLEASADLEALNKALEEQRAATAQLDAALGAARTHWEQALETERVRAGQALEALRSQAEQELSTERTAHASERTALSEALAEAQNLAVRLQSGLRHEQALRTAAEHDVDQLQKELSESLAKHNWERSTLCDALAEARALAVQLQKTVIDERTQRAAAEENVQQLQRELQQAQAERRETKARAERLAGKIAEEARQREVLAGSLDEARKLAARFDDARRRANAETGILKTELEGVGRALQDERAGTLSRVAELEKARREAAQTAARLAEEQVALEARVERATRDAEAAERRAQEAERTVKSIIVERDEARERTEDLARGLAATGKTLERLERQVRSPFGRLGVPLGKIRGQLASLRHVVTSELERERG